MTRLEYWFRAKTQYGVHSPFVFDLYREVLFASVPRCVVGDAPRGERRYRAICYKLADHFALDVLASDGWQTLMAGAEDFGKVLVVNKPHGCREAEEAWGRLCHTEPYRVSIDLYDVGVLFSNPRLHCQHFLLR